MRFWFYILGFATLFAGAGMLFSATSGRSVAKEANIAPRPATAWEFRLTSIDGKPMPLDEYRGRVLLVVNTASFCGFTPQYEGLQKLHETFGPQGLTVIGVPSGDFREQEHAENAEIKEFCESKFGITFPMAEKSVVTGANAIPLYQWARASLPAQNAPKWNFHKFLIGRDGKLIAGFPSKVTPDSPELTKAIEKALRGS
ncbi:MAG: glutathione peroxidase [Sphingomonadaceae bacterium]